MRGLKFTSEKMRGLKNLLKKLRRLKIYAIFKKTLGAYSLGDCPLQNDTYLRRRNYVKSKTTKRRILYYVGVTYKSVNIKTSNLGK